MKSKYGFFSLFLSFLITLGCSVPKNISVDKGKHPFLWENATIYFLMTDRFCNGNKNNDFNHPIPPAAYRGFMGGDVQGITEKIRSGYFEKLGVNAIWMTPLVENIIGNVDEGTGISYGFHGYWTKDWTSIDERIGTKEQVKEMIQEAHKRGIRILMDVVLNHTGPVTPLDPQWPDDWVRTSPRCSYKDYLTTTACTLVDNLPDIKTEFTKEVDLPEFLIKKWKNEGRYEDEVKSLNQFFKKTKLPRYPHNYIIKWLVDLVEEYGIDGYRVDTAKHLEEEIWLSLYKNAAEAYENRKSKYPSPLSTKDRFFMVGEVYFYRIQNGRYYDFGDKSVDYFNYGFKSLINFDFKEDATLSYEQFFDKYDKALFSNLSGLTVLNYLSSHDDGQPYDPKREKSFEAANRLLLSQGQAQIYYGDESARDLDVKAAGDAKLRSFMNWEEMSNEENQKILEHWQKLGQFRQKHVAIGAGKNEKLGENIFGRKYNKGVINDQVVFALNQSANVKMIPVKGYFNDNDYVKDFYSGTIAQVKLGRAILRTPYDIILLEQTEKPLNGTKNQ